LASAAAAAEAPLAVCPSSATLPAPPPEPPNGMPLNATNPAAAKNTTTAPAMSALVAPVPAR
jgi:hypothetical protein